MTKSYKNTSNKQNLNNPVLCIAAGGSGGHILPALQLAQQWLQEHENGNVIAFCSKKKLDATLLAQNPFISKVHPVHLRSFSLKRFWQLPQLVVQLLNSTIKIRRLFKQQRPEKIISTGGIEAIPVCLAAKLLGIPIHLYELNVEPGKAIKVLAPLATTIHIVFADSKPFFDRYAVKCHLAAYPLRFTLQDKKLSKETILTNLNTNKTNAHFTQERKTLLVLGGSQGSLFLNNLIKKMITDYPTIHSYIQVIHQTGNDDNQELVHYYNSYGIPAEVFSFHNFIHEYYALADMVLCRAGAGSLFELLFFEKKSIIIPLVAPTTHHQPANAAAIANMRPDLFMIITQESLEQTTENVYNNAIRQKMWQHQ